MKKKKRKKKGKNRKEQVTGDPKEQPHHLHIPPTRPERGEMRKNYEISKGERVRGR